MKKIVRLAMIRKDEADPCPFGLSIPFGCKVAGDTIDKLAPLAIAKSDEEKKRIQKANMRLLTWRLAESAEELKPCRYAAQIIEQLDGVECNYDDVAPGVGTAPLLGSPFYTKVLSGNTIDGLYSYPMGYYADFNTSRNLYYGLWSLQGDEKVILQKVAASSDDSNDGALVLFFCPEDNTVFMIKRSKTDDKYPGAWGFPGGHRKKSESVDECAMRELEEEIGFTPVFTDILSSDLLKVNDKCIVFVVSVKADVKDFWKDKIKLNHEHSDSKWFEMEKIPDNLHPVAEMLLKNTANNIE